MSAMQIWWNNEPSSHEEAVLPLMAPIVQYGDGLYETLRVYDGRILFFDLHVTRMVAGARTTLLTTDDVTNAILDATAAAREVAASMDSGRMKFMLLPTGEPGAFDIVTTLVPYHPDPSDYDRGYRLVVSPYRHPLTGPLGKSTSNQWARIAQRFAERHGADMALVLDGDRVVEATTAAVAWVDGDRWYTVPDDAGGLASTTVAWLEREGFPLIRRHISIGELRDVDAIILLSGARLAVGVSRLEGVVFEDPDRYAKPLREMLLAGAVP